MSRCDLEINGTHASLVKGAQLGRTRATVHPMSPPPPLSPDRRWLSALIAAVPWVLVVVGTVLFFIGLYYGEITEADTANGVMIVVGIAMILTAFAVSCVRNITPRSPEADGEPTPSSGNTQLLPRVNVAI